MMNNAQRKKREDVLTYRFYVELCILAALAVGLIAISNTLKTLEGITRFPDLMLTAFVLFCALLVIAVAYKVFAAVKKVQISVISANFVLSWAVVLFIASGVLFIQTLDYRLMKYDAVISAYTVLLVVYAVLCIVNFFLGGDFFEKLFKGFFKKQEK